MEPAIFPHSPQTVDSEFQRLTLQEPLDSYDPSRATPRQLEHAWDSNSCSDNMKVLRDGITVINRRRDKSSDLVRGKKGYYRGIHVFEVNWPTDERGSHPMIGVALGDTQLTTTEFTYLLGRTADSWGWNLTTKELFHDGKMRGLYPERNPNFEVPETFYIILNAEEGTLR
ncbi:SPRY domain-containing SOCS box protein 2-like [Ptychodera flava]|uniref:SPRY domain-containing SOCS box protein 2-like n=1 Tax=Ptychodera flava TaxID=63121 RepID=UPI00396A5CCB